MFGLDKLILSKPNAVKTTARSFTDNINAVGKAINNKVDVYVKPNSTQLNLIEKAKLSKPVPPAPAPAAPVKPLEQKIEISKASIENIRKSTPSITIIKPVAKGFLNQVNKIDNTKSTKEKLLFSYSDEKGRYGNLENMGSRLKLVLHKKHNKDYVEEQIEIYSLSDQLVKQNGLFIQVKGWGNVKDLSIANALKKSIDKFVTTSNEVIIYNYTVSSMTAIPDGGWECKVKVTPGKL